MTATLTEVNSETLPDLKLEVPCEHVEHPIDPDNHNGPAYVQVRAICDKCDMNALFFVCKRYWDTVINSPIWLVECDCGHYQPARTAYIFVAYL